MQQHDGGEQCGRLLRLGRLTAPHLRVVLELLLDTAHALLRLLATTRPEE